MKILEFISARLTTIAFASLSLAVAVMSVILFYTLAPKITPVFSRDNVEVVVNTVINSSEKIDAVVYVQINLETNSRLFIAGAVRKPADGMLVETFKKIANSTKFSSPGNASFVSALIGGNLICQDRTNLNPIVSTILQEQLQFLPTFKICSIPVINKQGLLSGYASVIWRNSPDPEEEITTIIKLQSELNRLK